MKEETTSSTSVNTFQYMTDLAIKNESVNVSQGIPENVFDDIWKEQMHESAGLSWQYARTEGMDELREAVLNNIYNEFFKEVLITSGCTESLLCALYAFSWMGYKNLVSFEPFYSYYPGMAHMTGLPFKTVSMQVSSSYMSLDWDEVRRTVSSDSIFLINTPHNPTGYVFNSEDWTRLLSLQSTTGCAIVVDDVYRDFNFKELPAPYQTFENHRVLVAGSVSKSFAASGARIGWLTGWAKALSLANEAHKHISNCQPVLIQNAASNIIRLLHGTPIETNRGRYYSRALKLASALQMAGFRIIKPDGGHFIMASHEDIPGQGAFEKSLFLSSEVRVTPLPLRDFFSQNDSTWMRFSFAISDKALSEACLRLMSLSL